MQLTRERMIDVLVARRDALAKLLGTRAARNETPTREAEEAAALTAAIAELRGEEWVSDDTAGVAVRRRPGGTPRRQTLTTGVVLARMKRFSADRRRRECAPKMPPQLIPATKRFAPLIRSLWSISLGEAMALLPLNHNGKSGAARRYYFVVRKVDRFLLEELPSL